VIDNYKKIVDSITASEELQNKTIFMLKNKANENNKLNNTFSSKKRNVYAYKIRAVAACFLIVAISITVFYRDSFLPTSKLTVIRETPKSKNPQKQKLPESKKTLTYAPGTVQARIMTEEVSSINSGGSADFKAPAYKNIKEIYGASENVIKGYVYSTDYTWYTSDAFTTLYTKSIITIQKSYKGKLKAGDKITVVEHGGVTTLGEWIKKTSVKEYKSFEKVPVNFDPYNGKSPNTLVDYTGFRGISAMKTGQDVVLFLNADNFEFLGENDKTGYRMVQFDAGKMVLKNGVYQAVISSYSKGIVKDESCTEGEIDNLMKSAESNH
jgi:hypothetical protein